LKRFVKTALERFVHNSNKDSMNKIIDEQPPAAAWYASHAMIMVDAKELEKMQQEIRSVREAHLQLCKLFQEYQIQHSQDAQRIEVLDNTFKKHLKIEIEELSVQKHELQISIAQKDLQHLARIQELEAQMNESKQGYETQIEQLKKRISGVEQQRIENFLIRTNQPFPYSVANSTNWLQKCENDPTRSNTRATAALSSNNAIVSGIQSILQLRRSQ
jgi:hypothetical protein